MRTRRTFLHASLIFIGACGVRRHPASSPPSASPESPAESRTPVYAALGGGHLIRAVSSEGRYVTLEDGSVWEIEPSVRFQTVDWEPEAAVTVRTAQGVGVFVYEVINTQADEGALARFVGKR